MNNQDQQARPLARVVSRELTREEIELVAGGRRPPNHTDATGPGGDDPGDPGTAL